MRKRSNFWYDEDADVGFNPNVVDAAGFSGSVGNSLKPFAGLALGALAGRALGSRALHTAHALKAAKSVGEGSLLRGVKELGGNPELRQTLRTILGSIDKIDPQGVALTASAGQVAGGLAGGLAGIAGMHRGLDKQRHRFAEEHGYLTDKNGPLPEGFQQRDLPGIAESIEEGEEWEDNAYFDPRYRMHTPGWGALATGLGTAFLAAGGLKKLRVLKDPSIAEDLINSAQRTLWKDLQEGRVSFPQYRDIKKGLPSRATDLPMTEGLTPQQAAWRRMSEGASAARSAEEGAELPGAWDLYKGFKADAASADAVDVRARPSLRRGLRDLADLKQLRQTLNSLDPEKLTNSRHRPTILGAQRDQPVDLWGALIAGNAGALGSMLIGTGMHNRNERRRLGYEDEAEKTSSFWSNQLVKLSVGAFNTPSQYMRQNPSGGFFNGIGANVSTGVDYSSAPQQRYLSQPQGVFPAWAPTAPFRPYEQRAQPLAFPKR